MEGQILEERGEPFFRVGDVVTIGDVTNCAFGTNDDMEDAYGVTATIRNVRWSGDRDTYKYTLNPLIEGEDELDISLWNWDINCFQETQKSFSPDIESSDSEVMRDLLGI